MSTTMSQLKPKFMGLNEAEWAKTCGLYVSKAEIDKLNELFKQMEQMIFHLLMQEEKNIKVTHYDGKAAYLKIKDGRATVAKTNQAFIIDVYNTTKNYKKDGKELPNASECAIWLQKIFLTH